MVPALFLSSIVDPPLKRLTVLAGTPSDDRARLQVLTIAGQETHWQYRRQLSGGPARSYWQFERGGGVADVFSRAPSQLAAVCTAHDIPFDAATVFEAMAWHDQLAASMARLLLWIDPKPLPAVGDQSGAWQCYLRNWRPGVPRPEAWPTRYAQALALIRGGGA